MSAGRGVQHSEFNPSQRNPVHFLQIWIEPKSTGVPANYQQKFFDPAEKRGRLRLLVSEDGRDGSLKMWQDARLYAALLDGSEQFGYEMAPGRRGYLHVARGEMMLNGQRLLTGDGVKIQDIRKVSLSEGKNAEVLLFDLP
jgi:redox-sensitive bicupin YhaK (pirin superfamily)